MERRYVTDPAYLERLEAVEEQLIEEYLHDSLPVDERKSFEAFYLSSPGRRQKVQQADALLRVLRKGSEQGPWWWKKSQRIAAAAAFILLAAGMIWWLLTYRAPTVASVLLVSQTRDASQPSNMVVAPKGVTTIQLRFQIQADSHSRTWRATLRDPEERPVATAMANLLQESNAGLLLQVEFPAQGLSTGDYILEIDPVPDIPSSDPTSYPLHITQPGQ
jgi:hypothetical protein